MGLISKKERQKDRNGIILTILIRTNIVTTVCLNVIPVVGVLRAGFSHSLTSWPRPIISPLLPGSDVGHALWDEWVCVWQCMCVLQCLVSEECSWVCILGDLKASVQPQRKAFMQWLENRNQSSGWYVFAFWNVNCSKLEFHVFKKKISSQMKHKTMNPVFSLR